MNKTNKSVFLALLAVGCCLVVASAQQQSVIPQSLAANGQIGAQQAPALANVAAATANCTIVTTKPSPTAAKYSTSCTLMQFAGYLTVGPGQYIELNNGTVNQTLSLCPVNAGPAKIAIEFPCAQLMFQINTNNSQVFVQGINGYYQIDVGNTTTEYKFGNTTSLFSTSQENHYYKCNAAQSVDLKPTDAPTAPLFTMEVSNFALESYRNTNSTEFYKTAEDCLLDSQPVSDLVRIGVGVCLVALVAIVLVAYFVGRRRWSGRSSYESV